jgi:hypothetical protein
MSLPTASQNTQYYLQAGFGLACAVASTEMALFGEAFAEASSLRCDPFGASSSAVQSMHWGHCLCSTILEGAQCCPGRARGTCPW